MALSMRKGEDLLAVSARSLDDSRKYDPGEIEDDHGTGYKSLCDRVDGGCDDRSRDESENNGIAPPPDQFSR